MTSVVILVLVSLAFVGCSTSTATSLHDVDQDDSSTPHAPIPSKGAILEALISYLFRIYPSSRTISSMKWDDKALDSNRFSQGTPKRLYYAPRPGKRFISYEENGDTEEDTKTKRDAWNSDVINENDQNDDGSWWWSPETVRRSPFSPRLGKRTLDFESLNDDNDEEDIDSIDESEEDMSDVTTMEDITNTDASTQRFNLRSSLVPRLGKRAAAFSPRLGKRDFSFSPRLGKRGDMAFSPRLGKKADFSFSPRLGKRQGFSFSPRLGKKSDFAFSPRLGKRGDFSFSPRLGKKSPFAFSSRLGKKSDFSFSPRLGKKSDFAFSPRLGKKEFTFSLRLGKRGTPTSAEDTWSEKQNGVTQLQQRSVAFSPRLG